MVTVGQAQVRIVADARGFARDAEREINRQVRRIDVDTRSISRGLTQGMVAAGATAGTSGARAMSSAFGAGIIVLVAALAAAMVPLGAAIAGALVLGFGGALAGIGIFAAAQADRVRDAFSDMSDEVGDIFRDLARPLEPVLITIAGLITSTIGLLAPAFRNAFAQMGPAIEQFSRDVASGFVALGEAIEPLTDAFTTLLEDLGPELLNDVFPGFADALTNLSDAVSENSGLVAGLLEFFLRIPEAIINFVAELTRLAAWFADNPAAMAAALGILAFAITAVAAAFIALAAPVFAAIGFAGLLVAAIVGAGVAIFVFRDQIRAALLAAIAAVIRFVVNAQNFFTNLGRDIRDTARNIANNVGNFFTNMRDTVNDRIRQLGANVRDGFNSIVDGARALPGRVGSAVSGIASRIFGPFRDGINRIIDGWNRLSFSLPSIDLGPLGSFGGFSIGTPNIPRLQRGGIVERSGAAVVGENGPELLFLPPAAVVSPLPSDAARSGAVIEIPIQIGDEVVRVVRAEIDSNNQVIVTGMRAGAGRR